MVMACDCINTIMDHFENALVSIIQRCPNLEIFVVKQLLKGAFEPVADALKRMRLEDSVQVHWNFLSEVIWALDLLLYLITAHIDIETPMPSDEDCDILWLCLKFTPSSIQLVATLITRLHSRVYFFTGNLNIDLPENIQPLPCLRVLNVLFAPY